MRFFLLFNIKQNGRWSSVVLNEFASSSEVRILLDILCALSRKTITIVIRLLKYTSGRHLPYDIARIDIYGLTFRVETFVKTRDVV